MVVYGQFRFYGMGNKICTEVIRYTCMGMHLSFEFIFLRGMGTSRRFSSSSIGEKIFVTSCWLSGRCKSFFAFVEEVYLERGECALQETDS